MKAGRKPEIKKYFVQYKKTDGKKVVALYVFFLVGQVNRRPDLVLQKYCGTKH